MRCPPAPPPPAPPPHPLPLGPQLPSLQLPSSCTPLHVRWWQMIRVQILLRLRVCLLKPRSSVKVRCPPSPVSGLSKPSLTHGGTHSYLAPVSTPAPLPPAFCPTLPSVLQASVHWLSIPSGTPLCGCPVVACIFPLHLLLIPPLHSISLCLPSHLLPASQPWLPTSSTTPLGPSRLPFRTREATS